MSDHQWRSCAAVVVGVLLIAALTCFFWYEAELQMADWLAEGCPHHDALSCDVWSIAKKEKRG